MQTDLVQRWNTGRASYRPAGEPIDPRRYEVAAIPDDTTARRYVEANHYSRSYPAARRRFGLYTGDRLVGVAVFSVPANEAALRVLPGEGGSRIELGRFVLDDAVPANGESWFLARAFHQLRAEGFTGVLSFSDPEPRRDAAGDVVFGGHIGTVYQALGASYLGRATARTLRVLPDGAVLSDRALQKLRAGECGWQYVVQQLRRHGAGELLDFDARLAWLAEWLPRLTYRLRHPGNHRYAWALQSGDRRHLPVSLPYPKVAVRQQSLLLAPG